MPDTPTCSDKTAICAMRASLPIAKEYPVDIAPTERARLCAIAEKLLGNEPALCATGHFGPGVRCGLNSSGPAILFADQSEIALLGTPEEGLLEYRLAVLAQNDDMLVLSHDRSNAFEAYLQEYLNVRGLDVLIAASQHCEQHWPLAKRCLLQENLFQHIKKMAREAGQLNIISYMSTGHVWNLARRISQETGADVALASPPPRLAKRVNDKIWFASRVKEVLGQSALSPTFAVYGPAALAGHLKRLAAKTQKLVIKIPDSAGSAGNLCLDASMFRDRSLTWIKAQLVEMLAAIGWTGSFPLKVEIWETPVVSSPSVQIWIPQSHDGLPIIEGLFEQTVEDAGGKFVGAVKSSLPAASLKIMAQQAMALAFVFQKLGYFGRCSLDALVVNAKDGAAKLHWVECNGRWGGVSIPMTLANRLLPDPANTQIMIVQKVNLELPQRPFQGAVDTIRDLLYRHGHSHEGIIFLSPTGYERGKGIHFMAIAKTIARARNLSHQAFARLTIG